MYIDDDQAPSRWPLAPAAPAPPRLAAPPRCQNPCSPLTLLPLLTHSQDGQDTAAAAPPADAGDPAAHAAADADDGAAAPAAAPSAEEVVAHRSGDVLLRHTILKSDHFPGCQNMRLTPLLEGAPNFRQVPGLPVYGAAIPTASGLRLVLDRLGAAKGRRRVLWHNMREEPVLYVNGRPFVVREADKPFANLEYTGIDRARVEGMEARLKADVLAEAARYGGAVLVAHEDDHFQVVEEWEPVTEADVQTPAEVYAELALDGCAREGGLGLGIAAHLI